jgi:non-homologous end joining protein Ku
LRFRSRLSSRPPTIANKRLDGGQVSSELVNGEKHSKGFAVGKDQYVKVEDDELANID